jgi:signal transduction histidine kinase
MIAVRIGGVMAREADAYDADLGPALAQLSGGLGAAGAALLVGGVATAAAGAAARVPGSVLRALAAGQAPPGPAPALDGTAVHACAVDPDGLLLVFRATPLSESEDALVAAVAAAAGSTLALAERARLLRRVVRIQRSISHRAPLQRVLDSITAGVAELVGDPVAGIRLVDPDDPGYLILASAVGVPERLLPALRRGPVGEGAGGRAITEERLVVLEAYHDNPSGLPAFRADGLEVAMAAPIHADGEVVGSVTSASYTPGRRYSAAEQEALLAFAAGAGLAITDARTLDAMREARRSKELLLAMVSHELKTPLTAIMGTLRTLERHEQALPPAQRTELLRTAFDRGCQLDRLIDYLLLGANADLATSPRPVNLAEAVRGAIGNFEHLPALRRGALPHLVLAVDPAAVRTVLGILLENGQLRAVAAPGRSSHLIRKVARWGVYQAA